MVAVAQGDAGAVVKVCQCGARFTEAQWSALPDPKVYRVEGADEGEDGSPVEVHEQRRCSGCGSHIVRVVGRDAISMGEHVGTALQGVQPIRVDVEPGRVKVAGNVEELTPATARDLASLLGRAARLAGLVCLVLALFACGGSSFNSELLAAIRVDAGTDDGAAAPEAGQDASDPVEGSMPVDAAADAREAGVDAGPGRDAGPEAGPLDSGAPEAEAGRTCVTDLSGVGAGDFSIAFDIRTTATAASSVLSQRSVCGTSTFWDVQTSTAGGISVETDDGTTAGDALLYSLASVNDGAAHHVDVARLAGVLSITIDGSASGATADTGSLGPMAPLRVGTSACDGVAGIVPLVGSVSGVCITR